MSGPIPTDKIVRDKLEECVLTGDLRTETDPDRLSSLIDARLDQDLADLRAVGEEKAEDYANIVETLLARAARAGISHEDIEAARQARLVAHGGFAGGLVWTPPAPVFFIAHELPRRIRFIGAMLKGDDRACRELETRIGALGGVLSARASQITGSLVVHIDSRLGVRWRIVRAVEAFSRAPVAGEVAHASLHVEGSGLAYECVKAVECGIEKAVEDATKDAVEHALEDAIRLAAAAVL